jgi:hypothetical protein
MIMPEPDAAFFAVNSIAKVVNQNRSQFIAAAVVYDEMNRVIGRGNGVFMRGAEGVAIHNDNRPSSPSPKQGQPRRAVQLVVASSSDASGLTNTLDMIRPNSNKNHMGMASSDCEITSGGVSSMPMANAATMI